MPAAMPDRFKEGIIARLGGLVVAVEDDRIVFDPVLVRRDDFRSRESEFSYRDAKGQSHRIPLSPGTLAFTVTEVLVVAHSARSLLR